jgi:glycosyltransferase involved in cell wall biosynthesis
MELRSRFKELVRLGVIRTASWVPGFKACYEHTIWLSHGRRILVVRYQSGYGTSAMSSRKLADGRNRKLSEKDDGLNVLFAGRLLAWKGMQLGLTAFAGFLASGGKGTLTIVGDGPEAAPLRALAWQLGLDKSVIFVTRIPQTELFELYRQQDVLLFPVSMTLVEMWSSKRCRLAWQ